MNTEQLVIVRRNQFATFALLAQAFGDEANIRLVWDRRVGDRRRELTSSDPSDRRRQDRRHDRTLTWGNNDYLLLHRTKAVDQSATRDEGTAKQETTLGGRPDVIRNVARDIEAAIRTDLSVLISGGDALSRKSLAHRIHRSGDRADRPLVLVDRETFIEICASGMDTAHPEQLNWTKCGTLLIEEVADLSWQDQSALQRFLERRALHEKDTHASESRGVRIISATGHWLLDRVACKQFRADLFYQLNTIHLVLPAGALRTLD